jgi:hypothetical protein
MAIKWIGTKKPPTGLYPSGGFISVISENPTSYLHSKQVGLGWDVYLFCLILFIRKDY